MNIIIALLIVLFIIFMIASQNEKTKSHSCSCGCAQTGVCSCEGCDCGCAKPECSGCGCAGIKPSWHPHNRPRYFDDHPGGFGLSSGEMKYQLPHPHDAFGVANSIQQLHIEEHRQKNHHKGGFELSCDGGATQAKAWNAFVWNQPTDNTNYFNEPYPEDTMSDGSNMQYRSSSPSFNGNHGYSTPKYSVQQL